MLRRVAENLLARAVAGAAGLVLIAAAIVEHWPSPWVDISIGLGVLIGGLALVLLVADLAGWISRRAATRASTAITTSASVAWSRPPGRLFSGAIVISEADRASMIALGEPKMMEIKPPIVSSGYNGTLPFRVDALGGLSGERVKSHAVWEDWVWTVKDLVLNNHEDEVVVVTPSLEVPYHAQPTSDEETEEDQLTTDDDQAITVPAKGVARVTLHFTLPMWPLTPRAKSNPLFGGRGLVTLKLQEVGGNRTGSLEFDVTKLAKLPMVRLTDSAPGPPETEHG